MALAVNILIWVLVFSALLRLWISRAYRVHLHNLVKSRSELRIALVDAALAALLAYVSTPTLQ